MDHSPLEKLMALHAAVDERDLGRCDVDEAERLWVEVMAEGSWPGHATLALADSWSRAGWPERSERLLETIGTAPDTGPEAAVWIAQFWLRRGNGQMAREALVNAPLTLTGQVLSVLAAPEDASLREAFEGEWRKYEATPSIAFGDVAAIAWWGVAKIRREEGAALAAADCLGRAIRAAPWRLDWWLDLADVLIADGKGNLLGRYWIDLPGRFPTSTRWLMRSCCAHMLVRGPNVGRALAYSKLARVLAPSHWPAYQAEAQALADFAALDHVGATFSHFWRREPHVEAETLDDGSDNLESATHRAVTANRRAIVLAPTPATWNDLGSVWFAAGVMDEAAAAFQQALALDPRQRHATINYAMTLLCLGKIDALRDHFAQSEFLAPLPKSLLPYRADWDDPEATSQEAWRAPVDGEEWRRRAVFSQSWWREPRGDA